ncbi:RES family NAD+ phosphorylase [Marinobacter sp. Arc7-DN-1]|uniref:RES family NAD+ phosphorylase n=1 Tax=Marinobacter sp. Arc7-DN-1 TaxID=2304594 RepID=UPI000E43BF91|nr:RES family NAD+ phosphorylase [Marinobacter sp. Arc7-DN-1]AXS82879.1 RES domain-containing protein [Marinobacter sp. Arc7-DN-1]
MRLFRIAPEKFLENYTGLGGSFEDGARWNLPQTPVMYFGLTASVAMLEMTNYTASPRKVPPSYRLGLYELDDDAAISELIESDLPEDWSAFPYPESTQEIGNQWLQSLEGVGLIVPSCAVSGGLEHIMVVNPRHQDIKKLRFKHSFKDIFNPRAFAGVYLEE